MGNILCGATNNRNNSTNLENIVEPIKEAEVVKEDVVLQNEEPIKEVEVVKEEVVLQNEEPIKEDIVLEDEPLDESVGSDSSSTTSSVNDTLPLVTNEKVDEEPVKKKRGRKKKVV
jgi:hypothetical protein